jgi:RNA polymerase sigma-70 factor, ECF subfamily
MVGTTYRPGNRQDFEALYAAHSGLLLGYLIKKTGDPLVAEEAAADAWLLAWQHWPEWQPSGRAEAWVSTIGIHQAISRLRKEKLRTPEETIRRLGPLLAHQLDPEERVMARQTWLALKQLPPKLGQAFVLRHYHGLSVKEIAQQLGLARGTVASRLRLARIRLRGSDLVEID